MALKRINGSGIILADTKFLKARQIPILWKQTMPNYVTTWLVSLANPVVFLAARMLSNVLYAYLSSVSTAGNFTNNAFHTTQFMSSIS